jgi:hypothetical protein
VRCVVFAGISAEFSAAKMHAFGVRREVHMGEDRETKEIVALKKILMKNEMEGVSDLLPRPIFFA